jgi:hypothetical protein
MRELIAVQLIAMSLLLLAIGVSHFLPPAKSGATGAATGPVNLVQQSVRPAKVEQ